MDSKSDRIYIARCNQVKTNLLNRLNEADESITALLDEKEKEAKEREASLLKKKIV